MRCTGGHQEEGGEEEEEEEEREEGDSHMSPKWKKQGEKNYCGN
jgi:hypothetical protein